MGATQAAQASNAAANAAAAVDAVIAAGPYTADWASLADFNPPRWFADAKFGIFIHWGLFTVPEYRNEWYPRNMYIPGKPEFEHHRAVYGDQREHGYASLIERFTAPRFDAGEWMDAVAASGARYVVPVAEHHDGFQMYASAISKYNAAAMGPKRDVLGELKAAAEARGLHFGASNHRAEHWWFLGHGRTFDSDVREPLARGDFYWPSVTPEPNEFDIASQPEPSREFLDDWLERNVEIVDNYAPELVYFDWWVQHRAFKPYLKRFAAYYYDRAAQRGSAAAICYKYDAMAWGSGIPDVERGGFAGAVPFCWQTDTAVARNSWCHTGTLDYKTLPELVATLVDTVAKNGNLLLNIGPKADGSLAAGDVALLDGIGAWLRANGEGIYGTKPWRICGEGPALGAAAGAFSDAAAPEYTAADWRFTARGGAIYAFCLNPAGWSQRAPLVIRTFAAFDGSSQPQFNGVVRNVALLGCGAADGGVRWERTREGLEIFPPRSAGTDGPVPVGFRIELG